MAGEEAVSSIAAQDLFLIEIEPGDNARYVVAERFLLINAGQDAMGVPWSELAALFKGRVLRAVPLPGRRTAPSGARASAGVSTEPGVSTNVEVNLVKIGRGG